MVDVTKVCSTTTGGTYRVYLDWELSCTFISRREAMGYARHLAFLNDTEVRTY